MTELNGIEPRKVTVKGGLISRFLARMEFLSRAGWYRTIHLHDRRHEQLRKVQSRRSFPASQSPENPRFCRLARFLLQVSGVDLNTRFLSQKSLREELGSNNPEILPSDFAKMDRQIPLSIAFQALSAFREKNSRLPKPRNAKDADEVFSLAKSIAAQNKVSEEDIQAQEKVIRELAFQASGDLSPMNAVIGGFTAQEVLKACSGKFHPLVQSLYLDALEALPTDAEKTLNEDETSPTGSRYDGQIAVFGKAFQQKIANFRQFLVGAGAIGCEMLKNWAMMGVGSGKDGKIQVTDLDTIERSNLNRQFLFRPKDLGGFKSDTAAKAVADMNPDLAGKIASHQTPVGPDSEGE